MTTWLSKWIASEKRILIATAVVSGAVAASAVFSYQYIRNNVKVQHVDNSNLPSGGSGDITHSNRARIEDEVAALLAKRARRGDYDEALMLEQLARNRAFLKDGGLSKIRNSFIIVVGCGGVGSHASAALARSGVAHIRLIDFDQVTLSSLNRHAVATLADVGTPKVTCLQKRLEQIAPWVNFDCRVELFAADKATDQLGSVDGKKADFIIDAIDNIDSKVALLQYCHANSLPVISSMGAACKSDPTRVFVGDISASAEDPLSRSTRRRLRSLGIASGIPAIFSSEKSGPGKAQLLPLPEEELHKGSVDELGVLPDFRVRILPVLGTMPAFFGLCAANYVLLEISGYPHECTPFKARVKMYDGILATLQGSEEKLARSFGDDALGLRLPITFEDVGYLVEEVFRGRSVISGLGNRLALVRWTAPLDSTVDESVSGQKTVKLRLDDLVLMTKEEASRHEKLILQKEKVLADVYDDHVIHLVEKRRTEEAFYKKFR